MNRLKKEYLHLDSIAILLLFAMNLAIALFPFVPLDAANPVAEEYHFAAVYDATFNFVSSYVSPMVIVVCLAYHLLWRSGKLTAQNMRIMLVSVFAFVAMLISLIANQPEENKLPFIVFYFLMCNLFLFVVLDANSIISKMSLVTLRWVLLVWALLPLALTLFNPDWVYMFFFQADHGLHGFAQGRPAYGLWIGMLIILLLTQPEVSMRKWWLMVTAAALVLSQSRAGIGALGVSFVYWMYARHHGNLTKAFMVRVSLVASAALVVLLGWTIFGRGEVFTVLNYPRPQIYASHFNFISENWLFGQGGMHTETLAGVFEDAPVHNLLLQYWANFGVIAAGSFMIYWLVIFLDVRDVASRMLLIFLFLYGQMEPAQGTANFFSPIPLVWFMVIIMLRGSQYKANKQW